MHERVEREKEREREREKERDEETRGVTHILALSFSLSSLSCIFIEGD